MTTAVLMLALGTLPAQAATGTKRFAVLASSNNGGPERIELRYANDDAASIAGVFEELGGVMPEDEVFLPNADRTDISAALADVSLRIQEATNEGYRTELIFYYSGHSDETGLLPEGELYEYPHLKADLEAIPVDVKMVVLDSCASGAMVRTKGGKMMNSFLLDESVDVTGHAYLTSSSADESAQESDKIGGSFFTHYLVSGMRGGADTSGDGLVTLSEVYTFAKDETFARTERSSAGPQHPNWAVDLAGQGDLVVSDINDSSSGLVMGKGTEGRLYVRDGAGRLVAELYKPASRELALVLEPGEYTVLLQAGETMTEATFSVLVDQMIDLDDLQFAAIDGGDLLARAKGNDTAPEDYREVATWFGLTAPAQTEPTLYRLQLGVANTEATRLDGAQVSLGVNFVTEDARGAQGTLGVNYAGELRGIQGAVGANIVDGDVEGVQASVGANISTGEMTGLQIGVGANIVNGDMEGAQAALVNFAQKIKGAQFGLVNVSGEAGTQLGLVNFSKDAKQSIGLISINGTGYNHLQVFASESDYGNLGVTFGGQTLYTHVQLGVRAQESSSTPRLTALIGLGVHMPISRAYIDLDVGAGSWQQNFEQGQSNVLVRGRLLGGFEIVNHFALFAGPTVNYIPYTAGKNGYQVTNLSGSGRLKQGDIWGGLQAGLRF